MLQIYNTNIKKAKNNNKPLLKTKDLKIQMAKNQDLFDDLLNNPSSENKMNIGENELFRINIILFKGIF